MKRMIVTQPYWCNHSATSSFEANPNPGYTLLSDKLLHDEHADIIIDYLSS
jgi:hypothetical protein